MGFRRLTLANVQLAGRTWEESRGELQRFLEALNNIQDEEVVPTGDYAGTPATLDVGSVGLPGDPLDGWSPGRHEHPIPTGVPSGLENAGAEGSSLSFPRLDHGHKRDVRVKLNGVDVATRNALDLRDGGLIEWGVTDDVPNDEVDIEAIAGTGLNRTIGLTIDAKGVPISAGFKGYATIPYSGTFIGWDLIADQAGSIVIDVWKDIWANFPPTVADSIAGTEKPTLVAQQNNQDLVLSTWTTDIVAGDVIAFNVDSASTVTRITLTLRVTPS